MNNDFEEKNFDTTFEALLDFINALPKGKVKMIDFERYKTMMQTAAELKDMLVEAGAEGEFEIDICDTFNAGSIKAELDELTVLNTKQFAAMIEKADNFEIYPKTNGKIQLNITFQSVLKTIG